MFCSARSEKMRALKLAAVVWTVATTLRVSFVYPYISLIKACFGNGAALLHVAIAIATIMRLAS